MNEKKNRLNNEKLNGYKTEMKTEEKRKERNKMKIKTENLQKGNIKIDEVLHIYRFEVRT